MDKEDIKAAFTEVLNEKMTEFWIDREVHYQHHEFLGSMIKWADRIQKKACSSAINIIVGAIFVLLLLGFIFWGKGHLK